MNVTLWVLQGLCAFAFVAAGALKLFTPKEKLEVKMHWAKTWPEGRIKLLGLAEVLGAIGLIAPWATGLLPVLTPVAAIALVPLMVGAAATHAKLKEPVVAPVVLAVLCVVIAAGRLFAFAGGPAQ